MFVNAHTSSHFICLSSGNQTDPPKSFVYNFFLPYIGFDFSEPQTFFVQLSFRFKGGKYVIEPYCKITFWLYLKSLYFYISDKFIFKDIEEFRKM